MSLMKKLEQNVIALQTRVHVPAAVYKCIATQVLSFTLGEIHIPEMSNQIQCPTQ